MKYIITILLLLMLNTAQSQNFEWKTLKTGAGGWITGLDVHKGVSIRPSTPTAPGRGCAI